MSLHIIRRFVTYRICSGSVSSASCYDFNYCYYYYDFITCRLFQRIVFKTYGFLFVDGTPPRTRAASLETLVLLQVHTFPWTRTDDILIAKNNTSSINSSLYYIQKNNLSSRQDIRLDIRCLTTYPAWC